MNSGRTLHQFDKRHRVHNNDESDRVHLKYQRHIFVEGSTKVFENIFYKKLSNRLI